MSRYNDLAARFSPIVFHARDEPNLPANVDWFLARTSLWYYDRFCDPPLKRMVTSRPSQRDLVIQACTATCGNRDQIYSNGTWSRSKWRTFFLDDISKEDRKGCTDPDQWTTYFHAYSNAEGGTTIQYWRFHAYNTGLKIDFGRVFDTPLNIELGCHGGDWEGLHVVLDRDDEPVQVGLLGHDGIQRLDWRVIERHETHPVVYSERGGHATLHADTKAGFQKASGVAHITLESGGLVDLGEKTLPANDQLFVQYSGLWGSPSEIPKEVPLIPRETVQKGFYVSSGYWGPAFNETEMRQDSFVTAWGHGTPDENKVVSGVPEFRPTFPIP